MSGMAPTSKTWSVRRFKAKAFTLIELLVVVSIIGLLAGLVVPEAHRSMQRSKINEVALELAGWLETLKINSSADMSCVATFNNEAVQPFLSGDVLYSISSIQQAGAGVILSPPCTNYIQDFRVSLSSISAGFMISSPATFQFTRRGNVIAANDEDIRILLVNSTYMRCLRSQVLLGTISIGTNNNATDLTDACPDDSFRSF